MLLRNYILAYFKTQVYDDKDTFRLNIPMDRGDDMVNYVHTSALTILANPGFEFTEFYMVKGKTTKNITDLAYYDAKCMTKEVE